MSLSWFEQRSGEVAEDAEARTTEEVLWKVSGVSVSSDDSDGECGEAGGVVGQACSLLISATSNSEVERAVNVRFAGKELVVSMLMEEHEIAPVFDGAAWAGTLLWDAAVLAIQYMEETVGAEALRGARVLELGCGSGIPGMCCRLLGAGSVVLTEQAELVRLLRQNLASNAAALDLGDGGAIVAEELFWGEAAAAECGTTHGPFDFVVCCDCVYEPLYGQSWQPLADTLKVLCGRQGSLGLISLERRDQDGVDRFLARLREHGLREEVVHRKGPEDRVGEVLVYRITGNPAECS
jgi:predicted nicotinamide N-methyase